MAEGREVTTPSLGMPIWYELTTANPAAAESFYGAVVGWKPGSFDGGDGYTLWNADDGAAVGGMQSSTDDSPTDPAWLAYFHVADVDAAIAMIEAEGGTVHSPPQDVVGAGRVAMVADPQGVPFYVITPAPTQPGTSTSFSPTLPQRCAWNELVTTDQVAALPFYARLLGWTSTEAMPMGPMGDYSFIDCGAVRLGAMMNRESPDHPTGWRFYFHVPDVDAAAAAIDGGGGRIVMGPMDVPGGQRIVMAVDPQGVPFGLVSGDPA